LQQGISAKYQKYAIAAIYSITVCEDTKYTNRKGHLLIIPVFSILPHGLIHSTHFSGKASWEELFGIPYLSLAVFSWDVLACRIHCIQEAFCSITILHYPLKSN